MPISASDIQLYKSTSGVSLGGSISTTQIVSGSVNNIFDNVNSAEAVAGDTEYRCIFVKNNHGSIDLLNTVVYLKSNTGSADTHIQIALDPNGANSSAIIVASENSAPEVGGVPINFFDAEDFDNSLAIGTLDAGGGYQAIWLKRTVTAGAQAIANDSAVLTIQGETIA